MNDFLEFLVRLAYQFGPFLFAVLFMVFIVKTAHTYNVEIANRPKEAPPKERNIYLGYFVGTVAVGFILVFISVGWWIYAQLQSHVYEFVIKDLRINQYIHASDGYMQDQKRDALFPGGPVLHDQKFVFVSSRPFVPGQTIRLQLWEMDSAGQTGGIGQPQSHPLTVAHRGESSDRFRYDEAAHKLEFADAGGLPPTLRSFAGLFSANPNGVGASRHE